VYYHWYLYCKVQSPSVSEPDTFRSLIGFACQCNDSSQVVSIVPACPRLIILADSNQPSRTTTMANSVILVITGLCTASVYYLLRKWYRDSKARQHGCYPPRAYPHKDPLLGVDLFLQTGSAIQNHRYLSELTRRYTVLGNTFSAKSLGSLSINSIEPENIKAVFSSNFKDWGVEAVRLPAQDPFCGRGFITTDGAAWEHSRSLLRPSFNRGTAINLPILKTYLEKVIDRIPRDRSTFDLQPMLFSLVCSVYFMGSRIKD